MTIHTLQPSCDAQDIGTYWQVNPKGHTSQQSLSSLKADCDELAHKWLAQGNYPTKIREDHSATDVLKCWKDNELGHVEIADLVRRRLCTQASSTTSCVPSPKWG